MRVKFTEFEGTSDEYRAFAATQAKLARHDPKSEPAAPEDRNDAITPEEVRHIFTRLPLSNGQRAFLICLYESGDNGVLASEVRAQAEKTPSEFAGVLGALGRRIANSFDDKKYSLYDDIVLWKWDNDEREYRYWLTGPTCQAIENFDLL